MVNGKKRAAGRQGEEEGTEYDVERDGGITTARRPGVDRWRGRAERSGLWWINYHYLSAKNEIVRTPPNVTFAVTGYRARTTTHFRSPGHNDKPGTRRRMSKMMYMFDNILTFSNLYNMHLKIFKYLYAK